MFKIDKKYKEEFAGKINQVFFYITSKCNASCVQCLYKPLKEYSLVNEQIEKETMMNLLKAYRDLGAIKVTFLGGEPTLHKDLPAFIKASKEMGYKYIRIDTNALFSEALLEDPDFKLLDEITFSLDDYDPSINDEIRGKNYYHRCVENIKLAVKKGYTTHITCCIHNRLTQRDEHGVLRINKMIDFAESLGVETINFHTLFKAHVPRDTWTGEIHTSVDEYLELVEEYLDDNKNNQRSIKIRFPQAFITKEEFESNPGYYSYCPVKQRDRALVFPDGTIRICSLMIGSAYYVAYYDKDGIYYNNAPTNETLSHHCEASPCTHQSKNNAYSPFVPVCISLKPFQNDIIWLEKLNWESKRSEKKG